MARQVLFSMLMIIGISCGNKKASDQDGEGYSFAGFSARFRETAAPYQLTDTALLENSDTATLRSPEFLQTIPDSLVRQVFGNAKPKYTPLARLSAQGAETYLIYKATSGNKKAAFLNVYDAQGNYGASMPFLIPDNDRSTVQVSTIEKSFAISRNITRRKGTEVADGKDVFSYNNQSKLFDLIMTDRLDEETVLINPIDTLARTHKFSGDYTSGKDALVSIRDGRSESQLMAFVHFRKKNGECTGELKGELFFTSSTTAVYRQGGDPCILEFRFKGNSVSLKEEQGCGNYRGLDCSFEGTYTRKKTPAAKPGNKG